MSEVNLQTLPPLLPADVQRTDDKGLPTAPQIDWEQFQQDWFKTQVVSLDTKLTTVSSTTDGNTAAITTEITARTTADSAIASQITTINANVATNAASIVDEMTARADADSAEATARLALTATVNGNTAAITAEQTARANADSAEATARLALASTVASNTAAITTEQTTRASADSAIAANVTSLTTTVGTNTSSISDLTTSVNGVKVTKVLKATLNGVTGGYDFLGVQNLDGTGATFTMTFDSNVVINGSLVVNGTINTNQIAVGATESEDFLPLVTDKNIITLGSGTILSDLSKTFIVTSNTTLLIVFNLAIRAVGSLSNPIAFTVGIYDSFVSTTTAIAYAFNGARSGQILEYGTHVGANLTTGNSGVFNMPPFIIPRLLAPGTHDLYVKVDFSYPFGAPAVPELIVRGDTQMFYRLKKR